MEPPILTELRRKQAIADIIRDVLLRNNLIVTVDANCLHVQPNYVSEFTGNNNTISRAILDFMFPPEKSPVTLDHFTSLDALLLHSKKQMNSAFTLFSSALMREI